MRNFVCPYRYNLGEIVFDKRERVVQEITCQSFGEGKGCKYYKKKEGCVKKDIKKGV